MESTPKNEEVARAFCLGRGFAFVRFVAAGAFKETYLIRGSDDTAFALKIHKPDHLDERADRELESLARCQHVAIANLLDIAPFSHLGLSYLCVIEEFLAGGSLGDLPMLKEADAREIGATLIDAIGHLASLKLVHRDIKPDNIMFREQNSGPVLVDLGLVRNLAQESLTPTWAMTGPGTPFFAPPEQLLNEKHLINWRSDQFALAVTIAFKVFGTHPFGNDAREALKRVIDRTRVPKEFSEAAERAGLPVLTRMLEPWPIGRFRTPEALATAWSEQRGP